MTVRLQRRRLQVQAKLRNEAPPNWEILQTSYRWVISECNVDLKMETERFRPRASRRSSVAPRITSQRITGSPP
jgi:hypothetical protein